MLSTVHEEAGARKVGAEISVSFGLFAVVMFFIASGFLSYWNTRTLSNGALEVAHTHEVALALEDTWAIMKDAETGQRGYILTGNERYLEPYNAALARLDQRMNNLQHLMEGYPELQSRVPLIQVHLQAKLQELAETITLRRNKGFDAALAVVITDHGKNEMDIIRTQIAAMEQMSDDIRRQRLATRASGAVD